MRKNIKCKKLIVFAIVAYILFTITNQQTTLNKYGQDSKELLAQIEEEKEYGNELEEQKNNVSSLEFIEQTAREKLDMYYPNEKVYVDIGM